MKIMVASDLHGSAYYCQKMLERFDREKANRLLLLGDILYHGPRNDLPKEYNPKIVISLLNERKQQLLSVRGNCDTEVDQMVLEFPIMADYCFLRLGRRPIFATHGHHFCKDTVHLQAGDILLHGHTHLPAWEPFGNSLLYLNPGSVSLPKEDSPHSYMILDEKEAIWKDLDGCVYHRLKL